MRTAPVPEIVVEKIILAPLSEDDAEALFEVAKNPASVEDYQYAAQEVEDVEYWVDAALDANEFAWTIRPAADPDAIVGMVTVEPESDHVGEAGFFVDQAFQGRGYASSALAAAIDWVFAHTSIHRVKAGITQGNVAACRVAEKAGLVREGRSQKDWQWRDEWHDSLNYAVVRQDMVTPTDSQGQPAAGASDLLVPITKDNLETFLRLSVEESQRKFVAPNVVSVAQAHFEPGAWYRGIVSPEGVPVGFLMVYDPSRAIIPDDEFPEDGVYIWRLMIVANEQHHGYGGKAIARARDFAVHRGFSRLYVSGVDGPGGPLPFYEKHGFTRTGRVVEGEIELLMEW
ncbi:MAG: N-acetyltransferase [Spirochaetales bacterium]|nr:MAG: N-acetyltransferase [Spirochaetales bacterium]